MIDLRSRITLNMLDNIENKLCTLPHLDKLDSYLATTNVRLLLVVVEASAVDTEADVLVVRDAAAHAVVDVQVRYDCVVTVQHNVKHLSSQAFNSLTYTV